MFEGPLRRSYPAVLPLLPLDRIMACEGSAPEGWVDNDDDCNDEIDDGWLADHGDTPLPTEVARLLEIGLQHEQQHQELLVTTAQGAAGHRNRRGPQHPRRAASGGCGAGARGVQPG